MAVIAGEGVLSATRDPCSTPTSLAADPLYGVYAEPKTGVRVVVVAGSVTGRLEADGVPMVRGRGVPCSHKPPVRNSDDGGVRVGRIYLDVVTGLAVRCVSGSARQLTFDGRALVLATASGAWSVRWRIAFEPI
jgi:hypothetical protein